MLQCEITSWLRHDRALRLKCFLGKSYKIKCLAKWAPIALIGSIGLLYIPSQEQLSPKELQAAPIESNQDKPLAKKSFVAEAVAKSGSAVVTLETQRRVFGRNETGIPPRLLMDPYFQRFFGLDGIRAPRSRIERGQGSGVIFSKTGLVLTNAHVIENSERLMVGMSDGRRIPGRVVGQDSVTDLAVIQLNGPGPWPTAPLGDSDKLSVGDWAIAVGNPFGLENTVTLGIISNLNRNVAQLGISGKRLDLIQTDAAINPGNSGGPLLNANGEVVGINTLVRSGPGAGLGFAIPINRAQDIANQLIRNGKASHPMIGVSLSSVPIQIEQKSNPTEDKVLIRYVIPKSPAAYAGLKVGDVILSINGEPMGTPADVVNTINQNGVQTPLDFIIRRGKYRLQRSIQPIEMASLERV